MPNSTSNNAQVNVPSEQVTIMFSVILTATKKRRLQFITPEMMLFCMLADDDLKRLFANAGVDVKQMLDSLSEYLDNLEKVPKGRRYNPTPSEAFNEMFNMAEDNAENTGDQRALLSHVLYALANLKGSVAQKVLKVGCNNKVSTIVGVLTQYTTICRKRNGDANVPPFEAEPDSEPESEMRLIVPFDMEERNRIVFLFREDELLKSAITIVSHSHNNIIYVGEHGVGKSQMMLGLVKYTERFKKNSLLGNADFYILNAMAVAANTFYTDELENNIMHIVNNTPPDKIAVLCIDNLADLVPMSQNDNTPDMLKFLLSLVANSPIRIVTTATFEQYKRITTHNPNIKALFERIDINEPTIEQTVQIVCNQFGNYTAYCGEDSFFLVNEECVRYIVNLLRSSATKDVAMPELALQTIDRLSALYHIDIGLRKPYVLNVMKQTDGYLHDKKFVDEGLRRLGFDSIQGQVDSEERLRGLRPNLLSKIFGQDKAVDSVAQTVLLAKAGLSDETKPLASYLFVGPTGVGKTELAKVLASELGVKLVRFDMSEYSEQHTVSKLVGSPAGYIGYDDGGLLTDAVRKSPNCILLFDEIEKAHSAVFNLLLQVLDYAQLTDNKGQKADFCGCIIIMTSNAGARFASSAGLGFGSRTQKSDVMSSELKRVFAPEFLNRLTQIVAFNDMNQQMASLILDRKLSELNESLRRRKELSFTLTDAARLAILHAGFSEQYGAREMDRAIGRLLKPLLMNAILFNGAKAGDEIKIDVSDSSDTLKVA